MLGVNDVNMEDVFGDLDILIIGVDLRGLKLKKGKEKVFYKMYRKVVCKKDWIWRVINDGFDGMFCLGVM